MKLYQKTIIIVLALFSTAISAESFHGHHGVEQLKLQEFLDAQGNSSSFFAPVPDYLGWTDGAFKTFALIDYAGLANDFCGGAFNTKVTGKVFERPMRKGKKEITVYINTKNALGFAQSIDDLIAYDFDFKETPTIFGNKVADICDPGAAAPALGSVNLFVKFTIGANDSLPDLIDVISGDPANYQPVSLRLRAHIKDGSEHLLVQETAKWDPTMGELVYSKEIIEIKGNDMDDDTLD